MSHCGLLLNDLVLAPNLEFSYNRMPRVFNHRGFDDGTLQVIASLRHFRDAVLELPGAFGGSLDEQPLAECSVRKTFAPRCTQGASRNSAQLVSVRYFKP